MKRFQNQWNERILKPKKTKQRQKVERDLKYIRMADARIKVAERKRNHAKEAYVKKFYQLERDRLAAISIRYCKVLIPEYYLKSNNEKKSNKIIK